MNFNNLLIVDACCLINICASGKLENIIENTPFNYLVSTTVHEFEMINTKLLDNLNPMGTGYRDVVSKGLIKIIDFKNELEIKKFIFYAQIIDGDGEAASLAIAEANNFMLATDDKKAIKISKKYAQGVKLYTTPEIIKIWANEGSPSKVELKEVIDNIKVYGHYIPSKNNPYKQWWQNILDLSV